jgi:hypothetical protein
MTGIIPRYLVNITPGRITRGLFFVLEIKFFLDLHGVSTYSRYIRGWRRVGNEVLSAIFLLFSRNTELPTLALRAASRNGCFIVVGFSSLLFNGFSFPRPMCCSPTSRLVHAVTPGTASASTACICPLYYTESAFTGRTPLNALLADNPAFARLAHP